ncbi:MAG: DUF881 domain-containing protein, partial [Nocardioides sp.]
MALRQSEQHWRQRLAQASAARLRSYRSRSMLWRLAAPTMFALAGALFITSAVSSGGTDLSGTAGRIGDLGGLAAAETRDLEELRAEQAKLAQEVDALTSALGESSPNSAQEQAQALRGPAGLDPVTGPGLTITLADAPEAIADTVEDDDIDNLVVHQQDIQAVANALWAGGAEAMTIQGQRVVSTTGIRCVGNTVVLHDVPYAPPYRISAIGPAGDMLDAVTDSPFIGFYLEAVAAYQLGWDVDIEPDLEFPGYAGSTGLSYARPAGGGGGGG